MTPTLPPPPPLPPPPLPSPTHDPTQVVLNLPPEVIDRLTNTDHSWFTQPIATVCAAVIALGAAIVAWLGIRHQANAEDTRDRKTARLDLLSDALTAATEYLTATVLRKAAKEKAQSLPKMGVESSAALSARYEAAGTAALLARHKLEVIGGVKSSADAMGAFLGKVADYHRDSTDMESVTRVQKEMHVAFEKDSKNA